MQNFETITIRSARKEDEAELADLAYRAYYDRFFNDLVTAKAGASLKVYPELIPNEEKNLNNPEKPFLCFVAEIKTPEGRKIIGFRKGYALPLEDEEYRRYENENKKRALLRKKSEYRGIDVYNDLREIPLPPKEKIAGSSSLYIDPAYKRCGIGRRLVNRYAREVLKRGFSAMMTSCYIYNDSQKFIRSVGGDYAIRCNIPCNYKKEDGTTDVCNIAGYMLLWSEDSLKKIAYENYESQSPSKSGVMLINEALGKKAASISL